MGHSNHGTVGVLIPCYNYARFLSRAVESALDTDGRRVDVLIIDDASSDDTPAVAAGLTARFANVTYVRHTVNQGHHSTYNEGIDRIANDYFVLLSADDVLAPGAVGRAASLLDAHPEVGLVYGRTQQFEGDPPSLDPAALVTDARIVAGAEFIRAASAHGYNPIDLPASVMVRMPLQHRLGGYLPELPHSGDLEMWLRFAAHAAIGVLDSVQSFYRRHGTNMSEAYGAARDAKQRLLAWELLCAQQGDRVPDHAALLTSVRHALATELFDRAAQAFEADAARTDVDALCETAVEIDPAIRGTRGWQKLRVKRMFGRRVTAALSRVRGLTANPR